ncbi:MAG: hypothetical protein OXR68_08435 [Alphaproteobacteria bacterium]|nr:hypothetical protein [Alphaproteobacteria bacterium]MDD9920633.1 hypothetical protein [Alphaproteobacteria bacterium]
MMEEIDSSRRLPIRLLVNVILTCFVLVGIGVFGIAHTLNPKTDDMLYAWLNEQTSQLLGNVHQTTQAAADTDWQQKLKKVKDVAEKAMEPVEVKEPLPEEMFDTAEEAEALETKAN